MITHASQLEGHSTWRKYTAGLRELKAIGAPDTTIQEYKRRAARTCFLAFADLMMKGNLIVAPFHEIMASALEDLAAGKYSRLIISCAPRGGKSQFSQLFVSWLVGMEDSNNHIIGSYSKSLSGKFLRGVRNYLRHKEFPKIFPEFKGFLPDSKYELVGGGDILATSPGSALTGYAAGSWSINSRTVGAMVIDDPLKNSKSIAKLRELENWWGEEASTRKTNRFCQLIIATRFHVKDLHGLVLSSDGYWDPDVNPDGWRWINFEAINENPSSDILGRKLGETFWEGNPIFTIESLMAQKRTMGSNAFSALYQGRPTSSDGSLCRGDWIRRVTPEKTPYLDYVWMSCDTAFSEEESADETSLAIIGISSKHPELGVFVKEIFHGRWDFPDLIGIIKSLKVEHDCKALVIEKAASGQSLIQVLKKTTRFPIYDMRPIRSKTVRLQQVLPLFEGGRVSFIEGEWLEDFLKELLSFPLVPHDDRTDSLVWGLTFFQNYLDGVSRKELVFTSPKRRGNRQLFED